MTTTTPIHTTSTSTSKPDATKSVSETAKKFVFPIALAVAATIAGIFLFTTGMIAGAMGAFSYPRSAAVIIGVYNIAIMVWPVILAIQKRQLMGLRLLFVGATLIVSLLMPVWLFISAAGLAQALWGLQFLGVVALVLHALAAYLLTRYVGSDRDVEAERSELRRLADSIREAEQAADKANKELDGYRTQAASHQQTHGELNVAAIERREAYEAATDAFKKHPLVVERDDAKEKFGAVAANVAKQDAMREEVQSKIWTTTSTNEKAKLQAKLNSLNTVREELTAGHAGLEAEAARLEAEVETSEFKLQLDQATKDHVEASDAEATQQQRLSKVVAARDQAADDAAVKGAALTCYQTDNDNAIACIEAADKAAKSLWRDVIIWPVVAFVGAVLLYPAWYGWVLIEIAA